MMTAHGTIFTAGEERPPTGGVGQDNGAMNSARPKQAEPARWEETSRAHQCCEYITPPDASFSPQKRAAKTHREKITAWVPRPLGQEVKRVAAVHQVSVSIVATRFLELGTLHSLHTQQAALLQPLVEQAVCQGQHEQTDLLKQQNQVLRQALYRISQTWQYAANILPRLDGMTPELLQEIVDSSNEAAKRDLRRLSPIVRACQAEEPPSKTGEKGGAVWQS